ncbi:arsenic resistance protein [Desulforhopalus singaporensis]|uniref:Arsenite efflux pump ArsB, ACR3 family n=1 Tax=Desulforhopalus singaporensis TaxID=91360 RepID=A0A1H0KIU5_9BACT|nr:bile acid:sodium symporter [Desulforhopalus singaporensis]SDO55690.1 Arsenite efflux pump ArsB, ACR3 family [Desulforhopalus singaporensis]
MWKLLVRINKNLVYAIPTLMIAGLLFGTIIDRSQAAFMKVLIVPLTFLMVYPMMVTLNIKHLRQGLQPGIQGSALFINFAIIPFAAYYLGRLFFGDQPYMALGLLLASLLPTSGMTISWTGFARGNMGAAINMTVIGLTLGSLATPFYVSWLLGAVVEVDFFQVMQQIAIIVFLPMGLGFVTRQWLLKRYGMSEFKQRIAPRFPALSTVGVLGIVFVAMSLKADTIVANPARLLMIFVPLLVLYLFNFTLSTLAGRFFFSRGDSIALVYGTVMRNLSIALAIAINVFGEAGANAALVIALAYIVQVQSAAWYVRMTDTLFGALVVSPGEEAAG